MRAAFAAAMIVAAGGAAPAAESAKAPDRLPPIVVGTDDIHPDKGKKPPPEAVTPKPLAPIRVDEKTRTVFVPARFTRAKGVVEWLLSAGPKHPGTSVLVTDHTARVLAEALSRVGLAGGTRPEPVGEERVRPPKGAAVEIDLVVRTADGKETRTPASRFLSEKSGGEPLGEGAWVYAGLQVIREADAEISVTDLSGSLITTNLRDSSALAYWCPKTAEDPAPYVTAYYASSAPPPAEGEACELAIRPAPAPAAQKRHKPAE